MAVRASAASHGKMFEYFEILESLVVAAFNNIYFNKKKNYVQETIGKASLFE